jgi:hypothetical protein
VQLGGVRGCGAHGPGRIDLGDGGCRERGGDEVVAGAVCRQREGCSLMLCEQDADVVSAETVVAAARGCALCHAQSGEQQEETGDMERAAMHRFNFRLWAVVVLWAEPKYGGLSTALRSGRDDKAVKGQRAHLRKVSG